MTVPSARFPKSSRLYLRKEINEMFVSGKTINSYPLKAIYKILPWQNEPVKMTVAVPKRLVRLAVDRNRVKRQLREAFRLNCTDIRRYYRDRSQTLHLLVVYNSKEAVDFSTIKIKIILILQRLQQLNENSND